MDLCHPAAETRRDVHFIDFDRAGDRIGAAVAAGNEHGRGQSAEEKRNSRCNLRLEVQGGGSLSRTRAKSKSCCAFLEPMPGYSGTPLVRKLGIQPNERIVAIDASEHYQQLLEGLPAGVAISGRIAAEARFVHLFVTEREKLEKQLAVLRKKLADAGVLWVSWPKSRRASRLM